MRLDKYLKVSRLIKKTAGTRMKLAMREELWSTGKWQRLL